MFSLLAISKVFAMEDLPLELSGSDTDVLVSSDEMHDALFAAVAHEAYRTGATFAETMGRDFEHAPVEETARPKLAAKPKSAGGWRAGPSANAAASSSLAAGSPSVAASTIAAASADMPCPRSMLLPIEWSQVRIFLDHKNKVHLDTKTSPLPLPHPNMEFRGYVENSDDSISAFFMRRGEAGTRMPKKRSGGINKRYFDGLKKARTGAERAQYRRDCRNLFVFHTDRFGPNDPEI